MWRIHAKMLNTGAEAVKTHCFDMFRCIGLRAYHAKRTLIFREIMILGEDIMRRENTLKEILEINRRRRDNYRDKIFWRKYIIEIEIL